MAYTMTNNLHAVSKATDEQIARALEIIGGMAESNAKRLCPVDTGNLRNSITHEVSGRKVAIGTNVVYAPFVELGTHNSTGGVRQKAQPFLRPAIENHIREYQRILEEEAKR